MRYLSGEEVLVIHSEIIEKTGGLHGVRDAGLLISILNRPKTKFSGQEFYISVFEKAAVYLESLVSYHVFFDGNKRTAIAASARFLHLNGFELAAGNKEVEEFVLRVAVQKPDLKAIAEWLKGHSWKI